MSEPMENERAVELLKMVQSEIDLIIKNMGLTGHFDMTLDEGEHYDPTLNLADCDITVYPYNDKDGHECICVGRVVIYPPVFYYKDGSGDPGGEDLNDIKEFICLESNIQRTAFATAAFAVGEAFKMLVSKASQGRGESLDYESEQKMWKEMEEDIQRDPSILDHN